MELALLFYFADIIGGLTLAISLLGIFILFVVSAICVCSVDDGNWKLVKNCCKLAVLPTIIILVATLLPSKQGIYQMAAAYGVQSAATNPEVQRVAGKSLQLLEQSLDKYLKEDNKNE